ncbi:hypothetical protein [Caldalkalibacillus mannanilyticus]|uniref:hypothetical protein n=1 Tax=Caldalkalibacillus mannanilyticus TaxID=1418 RepID=UPI0011DE293E|nr:hypothetical protein [Caldalkalibacillus mannanilyticus]
MRITLRKYVMLVLSIFCLTLLTTACSEAIDPVLLKQEVFENINQHPLESKDLELTQETVDTLLLKNQVGDIQIKSSPIEQITVHTTITQLGRDNQRIVEEIIQQAETSIIINKNEAEIVTHPAQHENMDIWKWAKREYGDAKFSIHYEIEIPHSVKGIDISTHVGEIELSDFKGVYNVQNNVGAIIVDGAHIMGKSVIHSDVGSLHLKINQMDEQSTLSAKTDVGEIQANFNESLPLTLNVKTDLGIINGASKGKNEINGGGPAVTLSTSVGAITVEKSK